MIYNNDNYHKNMAHQATSTWTMVYYNIIYMNDNNYKATTTKKSKVSERPNPNLRMVSHLVVRRLVNTKEY